MAWDPKTDYDVKNALDDMLKEGPVKDVIFTETGIIKEYDDGHMTIFDSADNDKGHNSYDFKYDDDGNLEGSQHSTNS